MGKSKILVQNTTLSFNEVYELLKVMGDCFSPSLCKVIDIEAYAHKLATHAHFLVCLKDDNIIAFTAYYKNEDISQLYVTLVCVDKPWQRNGLGALMFSKLAKFSEEGWQSIGLEVDKNNEKGMNFYTKLGFLIEADRCKKFLMKKSL